MIVLFPDNVAATSLDSAKALSLTKMACCFISELEIGRKRNTREFNRTLRSLVAIWKPLKFVGI